MSVSQDIVCDRERQYIMPVTKSMPKGPAARRKVDGEVPDTKTKARCPTQSQKRGSRRKVEGEVPEESVC